MGHTRYAHSGRTNMISTDGVTLVLVLIIRVDVSVGIGGGVEMGGGLGALVWG